MNYLKAAINIENLLGSGESRVVVRHGVYILIFSRSAVGQKIALEESLRISTSRRRSLIRKYPPSYFSPGIAASCVRDDSRPSCLYRGTFRLTLVPGKKIKGTTEEGEKFRTESRRVRRAFVPKLKL